MCCFADNSDNHDGGVRTRRIVGGAGVRDVVRRRTGAFGAGVHDARDSRPRVHQGADRPAGPRRLQGRRPRRRLHRKYKFLINFLTPKNFNFQNDSKISPPKSLSLKKSDSQIVLELLIQGRLGWYILPPPQIRIWR